MGLLICQVGQDEMGQLGYYHTATRGGGAEKIKKKGWKISGERKDEKKMERLS
jgi:hypothetical protein